MRQFFFNIDKIVFSFISIIYDFLITIARTSILSQADILDMADRIYKLLALFMIFKVIFSLIMYVVNPDDFTDKSKGVSKLVTNIVITLSLLILTPYIFSYAYQFQTIILEDNSLGALIFGEEVTESPFESAGDKMAYMTLAPFFTPNLAIDEISECGQLTTADSNGNVVFNENCSGLDSSYNSNGDQKSLAALVAKSDNFTEQTLKDYVAGVTLGNMDLMFRQDMAIASATIEDVDEYIIDYKYLFSTVLGVVVCLLLISFCLDVALRSVKLAFLQLVAPIPIISLVDPKSGKDGLFKKWYTMCFNTYLSLFIRLLAIYFAAYIISRIDRMVDIVDGSYVSNLLVKIVIIIGVLMFAKQLPKILEGLGIKLDSGNFTLNPLRKIEKEALGGGILKKPNDALGKFAKGGFGLGTLAKKTSSGIDAKRNGRNFSDGWNRYKGGYGQWRDKQREKWRPYTNDAKKKEQEGKDEIHAMRSKWLKGRDAINGMQNKGYYVGDGLSCDVGYNTLELKNDDVIILCSDGLHKELAVEFLPDDDELLRKQLEALAPSMADNCTLIRIKISL